MAEPVDKPESADEEAGELRGKLLRRLAVAGVLVALLWRRRRSRRGGQV